MKTSILFLFLFILIGCSDTFLDKKPNKAIVIPSTLTDLESILNYTNVMNTSTSLGIVGAADWFTTDAAWNAFTFAPEKFGYIWAEDTYQGVTNTNDWTIPWQQVYYSNVVLDAIANIPMTSSNEVQWKAVKGRALFHRAYTFYHLAQVYAKPYSLDNLDLPGLTIRTTSDVNILPQRSTIRDTYARVTTALEEAATLLPATSTVKTIPNAAAAQALLATVYLSMNEYTKAESFATQSLVTAATLIDYNTLSTTAARPIARFNNEVLFHATNTAYGFQSSTLTYIDTTLYASYAINDLRRAVCYRATTTPNRYTFIGTYSGASTLFSGVSTNETYITRAECRARLGNVSGALEDLNALLAKRYRTGTYINVTETNQQRLLEIILQERRKELPMRASRWTDLRRLNLEPAFRVTLTRKVQGQVYTLLPNSDRYVFAFPQQEILYNPIEQNPR